jgi:hypothetical protein
MSIEHNLADLDMKGVIILKLFLKIGCGYIPAGISIQIML